MFRAYRFFLAAAVAGLLVSCGNDAENHTGDSALASNPPAPETYPFTIDLLPGYVIQKQNGPDFVVYYFQPTDTTQSDNEGGIYFGGAPDTSSPRTQAFVKREYRDLFMGDSADWREFTTATYVQREVYKEISPTQKIHSWCYSNDSLVLGKLYSMIQSIRQ